MNRIDRLHAILVHLQGKKRVTAQELADRFGLSLRTVYRDIKALDESGVPVIGEAGIGYSVMEGYRLPPIMFTKEEASALLLGDKLVQQFTDSQIRRNFEAAMFKIKAVLRTGDKDYVEEMDNSIIIQNGFDHRFDWAQPYLSSLHKAIVEKLVVKLEYETLYAATTTTREVEPIGLCYYGQCWHCICWCRLRGDYRDFRLDRIRKLDITDESFQDKQHPSVAEYLSSAMHTGELQEIIVSFDMNTSRHLQTQKYYFGFVSEEIIDGRVRMKFLNSHPPSFGRWLLSYTKAVRVESPASMKAIMRQLVDEVHQAYTEIIPS